MKLRYWVRRDSEHTEATCEPECTFADTAKIKKLLNWSSEVTFEIGAQSIRKFGLLERRACLTRVIGKATEDWFKYLK